jgi:hypothetical protein
MFQTCARAVCTAAATLWMPGCSIGDNGLPADLVAHLKARGLTLQPIRVAGPLSKRHGFIVVAYDERLKDDIVSNLHLKQTNMGDQLWQTASRPVAGLSMGQELWGITGRPLELKLSDGGQFEYLYLLISPAGEMFLLTEYAYG